VTSIQNDGESINPLLPNSAGERKLGDWISAFGEWALPRCDAPESFVFWAGVYAISAVLRKQVKIPQKHLGSWECYPHFYIMFVGPPGMRKTTTLSGFARPLLDQVPSLRAGPTYFTKEALIEEMVKSPDSSIYLMVGEFADLVQKNKAGEMYDFLTSMHDNKKQIEIGTMMRGVQVITNPCLNMAAATTPAWIAENMTAGVIGGGFASRVIHVYEEKLRDPKLIYTSMMKEHKTDELELALMNDLVEISNLSGEFDFAPGMEDILNDWNLKHANAAPSDTRFAGYHSRKPMQVLKLAMIRSVSQRNDLIINEQDFWWAVGALEQTEDGHNKIFGGIGKNEYVFDMDAITGYVLKNPGAEQKEIYNIFKNVATYDKFVELLRGCVMTGDLLFKTTGSETRYYPND
jgi:hypothetical protein